MGDEEDPNSCDGGMIEVESPGGDLQINVYPTVETYIH